MRGTELLLLGTAGWTAVGVLGVLVSWRRKEWVRIRRGIGWLAGVWVVYLGVLVGVSLAQKQKILAIGQAQCVSDICFTVTGVEEVPGFLVEDGRRLVRVSIRVTNRGSSAQNEEFIRAYLVDGQGRQWKESSGINGVGLTARVTAGGSVVSEPVFKVAADANGLQLILTRGRRLPGVLVIGDSDSLLHKKTVVNLGR